MSMEELVETYQKLHPTKTLEDVEQKPVLFSIYDTNADKARRFKMLSLKKYM